MGDQGAIDNDDEVADVKMEARWLLLLFCGGGKRNEEMRKGARSKDAS